VVNGLSTHNSLASESHKAKLYFSEGETVIFPQSRPAKGTFGRDAEMYSVGKASEYFEQLS
jgi:hypothetical protein